MKHVNFSDYPDHYIQSVTLVDGETYRPDFSIARIFRITYSGNITLADPLNVRDGMEMIFEFKATEVNSSVTFGSVYNGHLTPSAKDAVEPLKGRFIAIKDTRGAITGGVMDIEGKASTRFDQIIEKTENFALEDGKANALYQVNSDAVELRVTCPSNTEAPIPLLSVYTVQQTGTRVFEFVGGIGVTIIGGHKSWEQYGFYTAVKTGVNQWTIVGGSDV